jgi:hypothetical protein
MNISNAIIILLRFITFVLCVESALDCWLGTLLTINNWIIIIIIVAIIIIIIMGLQPIVGHWPLIHFLILYTVGLLGQEIGPPRDWSLKV